MDFVFGGFELNQDSIEKGFNSVWLGVSNILDFRLRKSEADFLQHLRIKGVPVSNFLGGGVDSGIIVEGDQFRAIVLQNLGHHSGIREIPRYVLFGAGQRDAVHHLIDLPQLVFVHYYCI